MRKKMFLIVLGLLIVSTFAFAENATLAAGTFSPIGQSNPPSISIRPSESVAIAYDSNGKKILSGKCRIFGDQLTITWTNNHGSGYDLGVWTYTIVDKSIFRENQWPNATWTWVNRQTP